MSNQLPGEDYVQLAVKQAQWFILHGDLHAAIDVLSCSLHDPSSSEEEIVQTAWKLLSETLLRVEMHFAAEQAYEVASFLTRFNLHPKEEQEVEESELRSDYTCESQVEIVEEPKTPTPKRCALCHRRFRGLLLRRERCRRFKCTTCMQWVCGKDMHPLQGQCVCCSNVSSKAASSLTASSVMRSRFGSNTRSDGSRCWVFSEFDRSPAVNENSQQSVIFLEDVEASTTQPASNPQPRSIRKPLSFFRRQASNNQQE